MKQRRKAQGTRRREFFERRVNPKFQNPSSKQIPITIHEGIGLAVAHWKELVGEEYPGSPIEF